MIAVAFRPFNRLAGNNLRYIHTMSTVNFVVTYVSTHLVSSKLSLQFAIESHQTYTPLQTNTLSFSIYLIYKYQHNINTIKYISHGTEMEGRKKEIPP